jgi:hypothetical protein
VLRNVMIYQRDATRYSAFVPSTFPDRDDCGNGK